MNGVIRQDERIAVVNVKKGMYKLRVFADDLVLESLLEGIDTLMEKLREFGTLCGLKRIK